MRTHIFLFALVVGVLLVCAAPASAASSNTLAVFGDYADELRKYWRDFFQKQDGVLMGVLALGALALLIIWGTGKKRS